MRFYRPDLHETRKFRRHDNLRNVVAVGILYDLDLNIGGTYLGQHGSRAK